MKMRCRPSISIPRCRKRRSNCSSSSVSRNRSKNKSANSKSSAVARKSSSVGRTEMADKLTRSLVVLEREAYDTQKKLEQLRSTRESFGQHLELIEAIDPKSWNPTELHKELSRALSAVEDARTEFSQQRSRLQAADEAQADVALPEAASDVSDLLHGGGRSFGQWLQIGLAFTLPLIVFGLIALVIFIWMAAKVP